MPAEEAMRQAEGGGLTLVRADSVSDYRGVGFSSTCKTKSYQALVYRGNKNVSHGYFVTAELKRRH